MMEKYGVQIDPNHNKTASQNKACPGCGGTNVNWKGHTPNCARCGTEPFEPRRKPRGR